MRRNLYFVFTAASFALLVSAPGRFSCALILAIEMLLLVTGGITVSYICNFSRWESLEKGITLISIMFLTILYKQLVMLLFPLMALQLGFVFYIPAVSSFLMGNIFGRRTAELEEALIPALKLTGIFILFSLLFFLFRDIIGFGTVTLPSKTGIVEIILFDVSKTSFLQFFASIPGALVLVVLAISLLILAQDKFNILEKAGILDESVD